MTTRLGVDAAAWASPWRRRSVGEKAFLALGLLVVAMAGLGPVVDVAVVVVAGAAAVLGARVPLGTVLRTWALPSSFVAVGLLGIVVSLGPAAADTVWQWGPVSVSRTSLATAAETGARSLAAAAALLLLALTTPMSDLLSSLRRLGVPVLLLEIAGLVYRTLFQLLDAQAGIRESQAARLGYVDRRTALRSTAGLMSAVLMRTFTRARRLEEGLAGRGYDGALLVTTAPRPVSWPFVAVSACLLLALVGAALLVPPGWGWR